MRIPVLGGSVPGISKLLDDQRTVNWVPRKVGGEIALNPWPGLTTITGTAGEGQARGMILFNDGNEDDDSFFAFAKGANLRYYDIKDSTITTSANAFSTTVGRVNMAVAGTYLMFVDGDQGYQSDRTTLGNIGVIGDADFPADPRYVTALDGYFIVDDPATPGKFQISNFEDATAWDALDFATAEKILDDLRGIDNDGTYLWLFGSYSIEVWQNTGNPDFPFEPISNINYNIGVQSPNSLAKVDDDNSFVFLSRTEHGGARVAKTKGFSYEIISSPEHETKFNSYIDIKDATGQIIKWEGHTFYILSFLADEVTWVYDFGTRLWFELEDKDLGEITNYPVGSHVYAKQVNYVLLDEGTTLFKLDRNSNTTNGIQIVRIRETPVLETGDGRAINYKALELEFQIGVGTTSETEPWVSLEWSDDYGNTWSNRHYKKLGAIGEYKTRIIYRNLGRALRRKFRITVSDSVIHVLRGVMLDSDLGNRKLTIDG